MKLTHDVGRILGLLLAALLLAGCWPQDNPQVGLTSLATPELNERIVHHALTAGSYRKHCQRVHAELDALRAPVFKQLESLGMTPLCRPQAGFLGWFDTGVDTITLAALALEAGYLLAPGALFSPQQTPSTWLRMNIATSQNPALLGWLDKTLAQMRLRGNGPGAKA